MTALSQAPGDPDSLYALGLAHHARGDDVAATRYLEAFLATKPEFEVASQARELLAKMNGVEVEDPDDDDDAPGSAKDGDTGSCRERSRDLRAAVLEDEVGLGVADARARLRRDGVRVLRAREVRPNATGCDGGRARLCSRAIHAEVSKVIVHASMIVARVGVRTSLVTFVPPVEALTVRRGERRGARARHVPLRDLQIDGE